MKHLLSLSTVTLAALTASACATDTTNLEDPTTAELPRPELELGAFSISLTVADLDASRAFYEKLGFEVAGGDAAQNWLVLRNGTTTIGLFHGMFERNMLTFNPGWGPRATPLDTFQDVRAVQAQLEDAGVSPDVRAVEGTGPAFLMLTDPDGNPILIDQHVEAPGDT